MNAEKQKNGGRILWFDYLRIFATLAVIMVHISGQNIASVEVLSYPWLVFTVFNHTGDWAVPMFVMISGALFLNNDRPLPLEKLYKGNLLRVVTAFFFWSSVYAVEKYIKYQDLQMAIAMFLEGRYHMWYLLMTIGLYISVPVLRKLTESKEITEYFLAAGFFSLFLIPGILSFLEWLNLPHTAAYIGVFSRNLITMSKPFPTQFLYYFVLGYYLTRFDVSQRWINCGCITGILGYIITVLMVMEHAYLTGVDGVSFSFNLNILATTVGIFFFAKYILGKVQLGQKGLRILRMLSRYTFGAYLVHALVLSQFRDRLNLTTLSFDPLVSVLLIEILTAALSFLISMLLNQIPVLKKYIV